MSKLDEQFWWYFDRLRDLRWLGLVYKHDPRAFRVALLTMLKIDEYWARKTLTEEQLRELDKLAEAFFKVAKRAAKELGLPT